MEYYILCTQGVADRGDLSMAQSSFIGFDGLEDQLEMLGRDSVRRIAEAGGDAVAKRMQEVIREHHHVVTGEMLKATKRGRAREYLGGARVDIYPGAMDDGLSSSGIRNSSKAFLIERGPTRNSRGNRPRGRADHFVTGTNLGYEAEANEAMQKENERIMEEVNR